MFKAKSGQIVDTDNFLPVVSTGKTDMDISDLLTLLVEGKGILIDRTPGMRKLLITYKRSDKNLKKTVIYLKGTKIPSQPMFRDCMIVTEHLFLDKINQKIYNVPQTDTKFGREETDVVAKDCQ
jgi:hypothetical protein